jgi:hypothetical protein
MELGEIYKEGGLISYEKLFYFHYRIIPNHLVFTDVDGAIIAKLIAEKFTSHIKEQKDSICYDIRNKIDVLDEKTIVFNTQEIIVGNGYCLAYYYGDKRILDDEFLRKLAVEYTYNTDFNNGL